MSLPKVEPHSIPIVASCDNNYAEPLTVMLVSLLENTQAPKRFVIFIIDGGISEANKQCMKDDVLKRGARLHFLNVNSELYSKFPIKSHVSAPAYFRISIPELFHDSVGKVIYLDCDLIIKDDLQQLWDCDLDDKPVAAVENISSRTYLSSQLPQHDYFNSGVLIINLVYWRQHDCSNEIRHFKVEHPERISTNDQCALNGVFKGQWKRLLLRWNHQSGLYRSSKQVKRFKMSGEYQQAIWNPGIIHYIGWSKPWIRPCYHPLAGEYDRYRALSRYADCQESSINRSKEKTTAWTRWKKRCRQRLWQLRYQRKGFSLYESS